MPRFHDVIFLQDQEDFERFESAGGKGHDGFFASSIEEQLAFLATFDTGEYFVTRDHNSAGEGDTCHRIERDGKIWILTLRPDPGYAGLQIEVPDNPEAGQ